jgi:hypothetical protein
MHLHGMRICGGCGGCGTHRGWTSPGTRPESALSPSSSRLAAPIIILLYTEQPVTVGSTRTLHSSLCKMYLVSLKYLSSCSCLFLDVPTLLCKTGFTGWVMVSHNSVQTAFKIADLALHAVTLLTFHARIQYIYCYRLVAIMSTCYQLVAVESACMGQTDAPGAGGGSAHAVRGSSCTARRYPMIHIARVL